MLEVTCVWYCVCFSVAFQHAFYIILLIFRYFVTCSNVVEDIKDPQNVIIWDVKTGMKKRTFAKLNKEEWPIIK